jgi:hypothetical protein
LPQPVPAPVAPTHKPSVTADLTTVKAALADITLADISDVELAALITATYGVPQSAPGLLAWIDGACDWELNRRRVGPRGVNYLAQIICRISSISCPISAKATSVIGAQDSIVAAGLDDEPLSVSESAPLCSVELLSSAPRPSPTPVHSPRPIGCT